MRCANPSHSHFKGDYFTSVWVAATNTTCQIIVDQSGIGKTEILNGDNFQPARGATVYGANGEQYTCTNTYTRYDEHITYYVPANLVPCYGTYVNTGDYNEIKNKVFS